jgi:hypothetical protein
MENNRKGCFNRDKKCIQLLYGNWRKTWKI